jgi:hypothetical protein
MKMSKKLTVILISVGFLFGLLAFVKNNYGLDYRTPYLNNPTVLDGFTNIANNSSIDVIVAEGDFAELQIEGDEDLKQLLIAEVKNQTLIIDMKKNKKNGWYNNKRLTVKVFLPILNAVKLNGSGSISNDGSITKNNDLDISLNGSGNINLLLPQKTNINSNIYGSGNITLEGNSTNSMVKLNGSGSLNAFKLNTQNTTVNLNGSGNVNVQVQTQLNANIGGSGNINYKGSANVNTQKRGTGSINKQ